MSIISISTPAAGTETPGAKQRQQVIKAFAGTMAFGLVLASLYVGTRIVSSRKQVNGPRPVVKVSTPAPVRPIVPSVAPAVSKPQEPAAKPGRRTVTPRPGEKYVQVAAFGPKALDSYLRQLENKGLHPLVAPGPADGIHRILIGPYTNPETLEQTRRTLQVVGMDSIIRSY